jgi:hypothetical protein
MHDRCQQPQIGVDRRIIKEKKVLKKGTWSKNVRNNKGELKNMVHRVASFSPRGFTSGIMLA